MSQSRLDRKAAKQAERKAAERLIADNRKARHDYHLLETFEAGIALVGTEVKAIREGRVNLRDSFGRVESGEVFVHNVHIGSYSSRGYADHEPLRPADSCCTSTRSASSSARWPSGA